MSAEAVSRMGCCCDGVSIDAPRPCVRLDASRFTAGYPMVAVERLPLSLGALSAVNLSFAVTCGNCPT